MAIREFLEALADDLASLFRRDRPRTTVDDTAEMEASNRGRVSDVGSVFAAAKDRRDRIQLARKMYEEDPRAKQILKTLARDAVKGGWQIETEDERAVEVVEEMRARLDMDDQLDDWVRLTFRDGDTMLELGVTPDRLIADVSRKPTLHTFRNSNKMDRFDDPSRAFYYTERPWLTRAPKDVIWFAEWQVIHARWDHDQGNRYGRPLLSASISPWKKVKEGEKDIAVRRKVRAGMRYIHSIDGDQADVERYKAQNKAALDRADVPAIVDLFGNKKVSVAAVQGDAHLAEIDDVVHHIRTFWISSPVPMSLLGYGQDLNRDVLTKQKEQYDETLPEIQRWVARELLKPLIERQWLLAGIFPPNITYSIVWPTKKEVTAVDLKTVVEAAATMRVLGIPDDVIAAVLARYLPGIEPDMLLPGAGMGSDENVERLAQISRTLMSAFEQ